MEQSKWPIADFICDVNISCSEAVNGSLEVRYFVAGRQVVWLVDEIFLLYECVDVFAGYFEWLSIMAVEHVVLEHEDQVEEDRDNTQNELDQVEGSFTKEWSSTSNILKNLLNKWQSTSCEVKKHIC